MEKEEFIKLVGKGEPFEDEFKAIYNSPELLWNVIKEVISQKTFEIDFAGNVKAKISIDGNIPVIEAAMNGWGNPIDPKDIKIGRI